MDITLLPLSFIFDIIWSLDYLAALGIHDNTQPVTSSSVFMSKFVHRC